MSSATPPPPPSWSNMPATPAAIARISKSTDVPQIKNQFVATGKVSFEIRNLVRDPMDLTAAMLARCGGKGRFFGNHRHLMATQAQWAQGIEAEQGDDRPSRRRSDISSASCSAPIPRAGARYHHGAARCDCWRRPRPASSDKAAFDAVIAMTDEATEKLNITRHANACWSTARSSTGTITRPSKPISLPEFLRRKGSK
jgi:hypothetical protein